MENADVVLATLATRRAPLTRDACVAWPPPRGAWMLDDDERLKAELAKATLIEAVQALAEDIAALPVERFATLSARLRGHLAVWHETLREK
jgi:hypothetical protein